MIEKVLPDAVLFPAEAAVISRAVDKRCRVVVGNIDPTQDLLLC
ncbi:MAG TPA: hypothetical protein VJS67_16075 [Pseudonocardiaceae bacterium]|nr:hypothetical protein [Pseudonocardiaceae bacterium]